jgi:transcriptional regulator with XRE-family HTH domain
MIRIKYSNVEFGKVVKTKRVIELNLDLRTAAKKIGTSPATLSRVENGGMPDLNTYALLCEWASVPMSDFFKKLKGK